MNSFISFGYHKNAVKNTELLGSRGVRAASLAELDMPICPGFIITSEQAKQFVVDPASMDKMTKNAISEIARAMNKSYGNGDRLLLLKILESPMLNIQSTLPSLHHIGLTEKTISTLAEVTGEKFAYSEYGYLIKCTLILCIESCSDDAQTKKFKSYLEEIQKAKTKAAVNSTIQKYQDVLPKEFYQDSFFQFMFAVQKLYDALQMSSTTEDSAIMVQAMVYGNMSKDSASGYFYTHNIISGENTLQGEYFPFSYDESSKGKPISALEDKHKKQLKKIARKLEEHFKELRWIRFAIEEETLWLVDQSSVPNKSAQAEIKTYLDLIKLGIIDNDYAIRKVKPGRLSEILHPTLDSNSVKSFTTQSGGIAGAVGAAIGRVYFTADKLVKAYRNAQQVGESTNMILAMEATFAGDVKAIELAQGVLTSEGGYASHAPVVARSLGKVALVRPDAIFKQNSVKLGDKEVKEGDYITLNVPYYEEPVLYIGKGVLTKPVLEDSGLLEFLDVIQTRIKDIDVHANADQPRDAELSKKFNSKGIGLCRTEHMFFAESRINRFRYMILAEDAETRIKFLNDLATDQIQDFYELLKIMNGLPVTIRLLDAPLHEFLPHNESLMKKFITTAKADGVGYTAAKIQERAQLLNEFNPMLGHRGIRIAMSYPEIYQMQIRAIFEASHKLKKEGMDPHPEIMIPLIMNANELKVMRNGKRMEGKHILSINELEIEIREKYKNKPLQYSVGTMIELPAAALDAAEIARYAEFFSFGTNDLTQTTYGISRDDFNTFFSDYNELDLLPNNPFQILQPQVQMLIATATTKGRMTRPDLRLGLCGEHGATPENMQFIVESGLNYVSVSPYGIPIAKLALAKINLKDKI